MSEISRIFALKALFSRHSCLIVQVMFPQYLTAKALNNSMAAEGQIQHENAKIVVLNLIKPCLAFETTPKIHLHRPPSLKYFPLAVDQRPAAPKGLCDAF
jgi:hypothetical protein